MEEAAARLGSSVNTWLVRAVADALARADRPPADAPRRSRWSTGQSYTGWVR